MSKTKTKSITQQFLDVFRDLCRTHGSWSLWTDFVSMAACSISNSVDMANQARRQELYQNISFKYTEAEIDQFRLLFKLTADAIQENSDQDFLGDLFTILELFNKHNGQFFTPYPIAKFMASVLSVNLAEEIAAKGYIKVNDCCCGAGALLIAYANVAREQGVDYQRDIIFVAQDIDFTVAMMCYIQLSLLGCTGYVIVGNALTPDPTERENIWITPMSVVPKNKEAQ